MKKVLLKSFRLPEDHAGCRHKFVKLAIKFPLNNGQDRGRYVID